MQGVIDYYGPTDFVLRSQNQPSKTDDPAGSVYQLLGGPVLENETLAPKASPVTYVDAEDPQWLILHGAIDKTVYLDQAQRIERLYREQQLDVHLLVEPDKAHGWSQPSEQEREQVTRFLNKHLRTGRS